MQSLKSSVLGPYRKALQDVAWLSVASIAVKPLWLFFITVLCARILGAEAYGEFNTALSLAALAFALTNLGVVQYTVREVAGDRSLASRFLTNFVALRVGLFVPAAVVALGTGILLGYEWGLLLSVGLACAYYAAQSLIEYAHGLFQAFENLRFQALSVILEKGLVIVGGGALLLAVASPSLTLAGMAVGMAVAMACTMWWVGRKIAPLHRDEFDTQFIGRSLRTLVPFALAGVFGMMYFRVDTVIVEAMLGTVAAGQYGLAFRIVEALHLLPFIVVHASLYPRLSNLAKEARYHEVRKLIRFGAGVLTAASVLITVALSLMAPTLIGWVATDPLLDPAGPTLRLLSWVFPATCLRVLLYATLLALNDQRFIAAAIGTAVLFNIVMNFVLLPVLGIEGAALATIGSELALLAVYAVRYRTRLYTLST